MARVRRFRSRGLTDQAVWMMLHEPLCDRINRGFYRFGETILELNIINHKLMARTEAGRLCGVQETTRFLGRMPRF